MVLLRLRWGPSIFYQSWLCFDPAGCASHGGSPLTIYFPFSVPFPIPNLGLRRGPLSQHWRVLGRRRGHGHGNDNGKRAGA